MNKVIILRYGEIYLKGNNRAFFEKILIKNIKEKIVAFEAKVKRISGRYVVFGYLNQIENNLVAELKKVFGLVSLSRAVVIVSNKEIIENYVKQIELEKDKTFRVSVTRADKTFPISSIDFGARLGEIILEKNKNKVNLSKPDIDIIVDIREDGNTYVMTDKEPCVGGMPVGTAGKGLLLLSGGIDSPVAGYMIAKRGMTISALHFHSFPYTSAKAKEKVIELKNLMQNYCGNIKMYVCSFTQIQEEIHKHCAPEFMITIMRRIMMQIAEKICKKYKLQAIITGESLAQVASQTIESITSTNIVLQTIPVLRPCIGMDKIEIIEISEKIGTFETSILPYEDCCTVFLPKNPVIKPRLQDVAQQEAKLDVQSLINNALENLEIIIN